MGGAGHDVERDRDPLRLKHGEEELLRLDEVKVAVGERAVRLELLAQDPGRVARGEERVHGSTVSRILGHRRSTHLADQRYELALDRPSLTRVGLHLPYEAPSSASLADVLNG